MVVDSEAGESAHTDCRAESKHVFLVRREKKGKRTGQTSSGYDQRVTPLQLFRRANFDGL